MELTKSRSTPATKYELQLLLPRLLVSKMLKKNRYLLRLREDNCGVGNCNQMAAKFNYKG
jgi:hypothetical protein